MVTKAETYSFRLDKPFKIEDDKMLFLGNLQLKIENTSGGIRLWGNHKEGFIDEAIDHIKTIYSNLDFCKMENTIGQTYTGKHVNNEQ